MKKPVPILIACIVSLLLSGIVLQAKNIKSVKSSKKPVVKRVATKPTPVFWQFEEDGCSSVTWLSACVQVCQYQGDEKVGCGYDGNRCCNSTRP